MKTNNVETDGNWTTAKINAEIARVLAENPDLPVKVHISGELSCDLNEWYIGEIYGCGVTEYLEYDPTEHVYFGRDCDALRRDVRLAILSKRRREIYNELPKDPPDELGIGLYKREKQADRLVNESLPDAELGRLTDERIAAMDWKPCIRILVGPCKDLEEGADVQKK